MINNRQGGRRRGRGGQRGQNIGGQSGNRQDNRQRGNAAQLLEKYKGMARDAQLSGDRVQTEYFLQFADHYFRVLSENQRRFEDQRRARGDDLDDEDGDEAEMEAEGADVDATEPQDERPVRRERQRRPSDDANGERPAGRQRRESRESRRNDPANDSETIPMDVLPPAIGRDSENRDEADEEEAPRPARRRARTPRTTESDDGVAPAA